MLKDQQVVIVGGTSGIGLAAAEAFLAQGAKVVVASRSVDKLRNAEAHFSGRVLVRELDFQDSADLRRMFGALGPIHHLVVTAGEAVMGPFPDVPIEAARAAFDSKFWGQYQTVLAVLPYLQPTASITLTSGVYANRPPKGAATLAALNSAVEGLVRGLAVELAPVRVNTVSPGVVDTPLYGGMPDQDRKALFDSVAGHLPVGHVSTPLEIAEAYVYLANSTFTTGTVLVVDGGAQLV